MTMWACEKAGARYPQAIGIVLQAPLEVDERRLAEETHDRAGCMKEEGLWGTEHACAYMLRTSSHAGAGGLLQARQGGWPTDVRHWDTHAGGSSNTWQL